MTDNNLAIVDLDQFPEGWIETKKGKKRTQIGVATSPPRSLVFTEAVGGSTSSATGSNLLESRSNPKRSSFCIRSCR